MDECGRLLSVHGVGSVDKTALGATRGPSVGRLLSVLFERENLMLFICFVIL